MLRLKDDQEKIPPLLMYCPHKRQFPAVIGTLLVILIVINFVILEVSPISAIVSSHCMLPDLHNNAYAYK